MPSKNRWRNQFKLLPSQSDFHNKVREILATDSFFKKLKCYQEVPVKDLCEDYPYNHYYDWYIQELGFIIELHGEQHYKLTNRGNIAYEEAARNFRDLQYRDSIKKQAAISNGFVFIEIPYKEYKKLTAQRFKTLIGI